MLDSGLAFDMASVTTAGVENGGDHYVPTMQLLRAGYPVLGEKPISNEIPKAEEMVALARKKNLRYGVNLNHRFTPAALQAKEWMVRGRLGEVNMINMTMWINNKKESSPHFHMRALHPHSLDVMRYFAQSEVSKVNAFSKGQGTQDLVQCTGQPALRKWHYRALARAVMMATSAQQELMGWRIWK